MCRLNLLAIRTGNIDLLKELYELLGLNFEYHRHGKMPYHYSFEKDGFVFEIYPLRKNKIVDNSIRLGFEIENLDEKIKELGNENIVIKMDKLGKIVEGYKSLNKEENKRYEMLSNDLKEDIELDRIMKRVEL